MSVDEVESPMGSRQESLHPGCDGNMWLQDFWGIWLLGWGAHVRFSRTGARLDNVARSLGPWSSGGSGVGRVSLNPSRFFALHEVLLFCGGSR